MTCQLFCTSPSSWLFNVDELAKSFLKGAIKLFGTGAKGTFWVWAQTSFVGRCQVKSIFQCFFWDPCHGADLSPIWNVSAPFWSFQTWKGLWAGAETGQTTSLPYRTPVPVCLTSEGLWSVQCATKGCWQRFVHKQTKKEDEKESTFSLLSNTVCLCSECAVDYMMPQRFFLSHFSQIFVSLLTLTDSAFYQRRTWLNEYTNYVLQLDGD